MPAKGGRKEKVMKTLVTAALSIVLALAFMMFASAPFTTVALAQQPQAEKPAVAQDAGKKDMVPASVPEAEPIDVSGNWTWRIQSFTSTNTVTFYVRLKQTGEDVKGNYDCLDCAIIVYNVPVKGTLKDGKLTLVREDLPFTGFELVPTKDAVNGIYVGRYQIRYRVEGKRVK